MALLQRYKNGRGIPVSVSLFDTAIASLANQATNWLIAHHLPVSQGSLHPNIAPYGELFSTADHHTITFAIGSDRQFQKLCGILGLEIAHNARYSSNQERVKHREELSAILGEKIRGHSFQDLYQACLELDIPIGKIRNLEEVFQLPEAQQLVRSWQISGKSLKTVSSIGFRIES